ncbi:hypothetical protein RAN53_12270 [Halomonas sp. SSL-5]|uniref:hypothetical protein n=1 Tax=Halomonas sp. SSL-5 TaxID=3065855 RepID=UPI0027386786|nr:hypothetical protein [Halomonas sp. SSL-5]MDY7117121.1 hypothetical protein [Halomonas sp. SSL-5]
MFSFLVAIGISILLAVVAFMLMPRPKNNVPDMSRDLEMPTAEAGRPIPVVFGEGTIKSPNTLWYGDKDQETVEISA